MTDNKPNYKVVLLIDENNVDIAFKNESWPCNALRFACLKVLSYFSAEVRNDNKHFQWGFKIYNSSKLLPPHKSVFRKFGDFSLSLFEDFENTLDCRLDNQNVDCEEHSEHLEEDRDSMYWQSRTSLRKALQDVLLDFQWDAPDIMSPVKRRPRSRLGPNVKEHEEFDGKQSIVFIVSRCPQSEVDVQSFSGGKVYPDAVLNSFLPGAGFCEGGSRRVFWIDTNPIWDHQLSKDIEGVWVMNNALKLVHGAVVPLSALLHYNPATNSHLAPPESDQSHDSLLVCPASHVLSYHIKQKPKVLPTPAKASLVLDRDKRLQTLCTLDARNVTCLSLSQPRPKSRTCTINIVEDDADEVSTECAISNNHIPSVDTHENFKSWTFVMIGRIANSELALNMVCSQPSYILTAPVEDDQVSIYPSLLMSLAANSLSLLVESRQDNHLPRVGVIRPLTCTSATLIFIPSHKNNLALTLTELFISDDASQPAWLDSFLQRYPERLHGVQNWQPSNGQHCQSKPQENGSTSSVKFQPEMMEKWFKPQLLDHLPAVIDVPTAAQSSSAPHDLDTILTSLQQKYRLLASATRNSQSSVRRSPRKRPPAAVSSETCTLPSSTETGTRSKMLVGGKSASGSRRTRSSTSGLLHKRTGTEEAVESSASRSIIIMKRSREALRQRDVLPEPSRNVRRSPRKLSPKKQNAWASLDSLHQHLMEQLDQVLVGRVDPLTWAAMAVMATLRYHGTNTSSLPDAQVVSKTFFEEEFCVGCEAVKEKHGSEPESHFIQCQVQCVLRIELYSQCGGDVWTEDMVDAYVTQVASFLRAMTFMKEPAFLNKYLSETLLIQYVSTCGLMLVALYDELMQALPPSLLPYASASEDPLPTPGSNWKDTMSDMVPNSIAASSNSDRRQSKIKRHASFNTGPRRAIALPCQEKNTKVSKKTGQKKSTAARRNLFEEPCRSAGMVRHNSVAVMEGRTNPGLKTPVRKAASSKVSSAKTPKGHHILKTRLVTETPAHKQVSHRLWRQQDRKRKSSSVPLSPKLSIGESPDKAAHYTVGAKPERSTPGELRPKLLRHASFYQGTRSRSVSSYEEIKRLKPARLLSPKPVPHENIPMFTSPLSKLTRSSPRRVRTTTLFGSILQNSPSRRQFGSNYESPMTKASLGDAMAQFDSPSKHTRLQALKARMMTQGETNACKNLTSMFSTPKKNHTPVRNMTAQVPPTSNINQGLLSPSVRDVTRLSIQSPAKSTPPVIRSSKKQLFCSPVKRVELKLMSPEALLMSPSRVTRSMSQVEASADEKTDLPPAMSCTPPSQKATNQSTPPSASRSGNNSLSKSPQVSPFDKWRKVKPRFLSPCSDKNGRDLRTRSDELPSHGPGEHMSSADADREEEAFQSSEENNPPLKRRVKSAYRKSKAVFSMQPSEFEGKVASYSEANGRQVHLTETSHDSAYEANSATGTHSYCENDEVFIPGVSPTEGQFSFKNNFPAHSMNRELLSFNSDTNMEFPSLSTSSLNAVDARLRDSALASTGCILPEDYIDSGVETRSSSQNSRSHSPTFSNKLLTSKDAMEGSQPPSPVFTSPVTAQKRCVDIVSPKTKFSPNVSQKSIQHLIESPLLQSPNTREARKLMQKDMSPCTPRRPGKKCKRVLCDT